MANVPYQESIGFLNNSTRTTQPEKCICLQSSRPLLSKYRTTTLDRSEKHPRQPKGHEQQRFVFCQH